MGVIEWWEPRERTCPAALEQEEIRERDGWPRVLFISRKQKTRAQLEKKRKEKEESNTAPPVVR